MSGGAINGWQITHEIPASPFRAKPSEWNETQRTAIWFMPPSASNIRASRFSTAPSLEWAAWGNAVARSKGENRHLGAMWAEKQPMGIPPTIRVTGRWVGTNGNPGNHRRDVELADGLADGICS